MGQEGGLQSPAFVSNYPPKGCPATIAPPPHHCGGDQNATCVLQHASMVAGA